MWSRFILGNEKYHWNMRKHAIVLYLRRDYLCDYLVISNATRKFVLDDVGPVRLYSIPLALLYNDDVKKGQCQYRGRMDMECAEHSGKRSYKCN